MALFDRVLVFSIGQPGHALGRIVLLGCSRTGSGREAGKCVERDDEFSVLISDNRVLRCLHVATCGKFVGPVPWFAI